MHISWIKLKLNSNTCFFFLSNVSKLRWSVCHPIQAAFWHTFKRFLHFSPGFDLLICFACPCFFLISIQTHRFTLTVSYTQLPCALAVLSNLAWLPAVGRNCGWAEQLSTQDMAGDNIHQLRWTLYSFLMCRNGPEKKEPENYRHCNGSNSHICIEFQY